MTISFLFVLAEVKIFSRKCIFYMEICSCCKNDRLQINIYSDDIYPGAYLRGTIRFFLLVTHFHNHRKENVTLQWLEILHVTLPYTITETLIDGTIIFLCYSMHQ